MNASPDEAFSLEYFRISFSVFNLLSPLQVKEWQQQLLQQLGSETCERLRRRGQRKAQVQRAKVKPALTVPAKENAYT